MASGSLWAAGDDFTLADAAAAPALFYAGTVEPLNPAQAALRAYFDRLMARPSMRRVLKEAEPYFHMFPGGKLSMPDTVGGASM